MNTIAELKNPTLAAPLSHKVCDVIGCSNRAWPGKNTCLHCAAEITALNAHSRNEAAEWEKKRRQQPSRLNNLAAVILAVGAVWALTIAFWPYIYATVELWTNLLSN
jgi:hypothetical protein